MAPKNPQDKEPPRRPLTALQLKELCGYLDALLPREYCDRTHRFTREFLEHRAIPVEPVLDWMEYMGGFCDCEVYLNVVRASWQ